jgi:hypothetical protein
MSIIPSRPAHIRQHQDEAAKKIGALYKEHNTVTKAAAILASMRPRR